MSNIKITTENLRFFLKVSTVRINNLKKKRFNVRQNNLKFKKQKDKENRIEGKNKKFFKAITSAKRIKNINALKGPLQFGMSILEVVSLLLLGTAINNIDAIKEKVEELKEKIQKPIDKVKKFVNSIVTATNDFVKFFEEKLNIDLDNESEVDQLNKDIKTLEELNNELDLLLKDPVFQKTIDDAKNLKEVSTENLASELDQKLSPTNLSFTDAFNFKSDLFDNTFDTNTLNLSDKLYNSELDYSASSFSYNFDLNPKPKRSDFPPGRSGGKEFNKAMKMWRKNSKSYNELVPKFNLNNENIFIFRQPIIVKE